jgi:hypothetical protein
MPHPLEIKLARLRRRARSYVCLKAVSRAFVLVVAAALALALADGVFRVQDRGLRSIFTLTLLTVAAIGVRRIVQAIHGSRYRDVQIALRIEQTYPQLRGRLANAIEFVHQRDDDALAGSSTLRRAVIREVTTQTQHLDLGATLDARPSRRAALLAAATLAAVVLLVALDGATARIAVIRLINPLSDIQWPRANRLAFKEPIKRLPLGQTFEVQVIDAGGAPLPDDVTMHYRYRDPDDNAVEESEPLQWIDQMLLARRELVDRPFEYRAVGGDDHAMAWTQLEVVEPPVMRESCVTLSYPAYTGWPNRAGELHIRALVGTKVCLEAKASKALDSATVQFGDAESIAAAVSADGYSFAVPADSEHEFVVNRSGTYWIELVDREGFHSDAERKYQIRAVPDAPPTVEIEHPKANIFVTGDATLPLSLVARDDLALRGISIDYLRSDKSDEGEKSIDVQSGPEQVPAELALRSAAEDFAGDSRAASQNWDLKPLELPPGTQVTFHASAVDYAAQTGHSLPRRLTVVTAEEIQDRLAERQSVIFNELARVLEMEQTARSHVSGLEVQLDQTGKLSKSDVDVLQGAGLNQQQVERELTSEHDGVRGQIDDFLDELKINKVDGPDTHRAMQGVLDELARLGQGPLPEAARELTAASKAAQIALQDAAESAPEPRASVLQALDKAGAAQDDVAGSLSRLMDDMREWVNYRHFHREIGQMSKSQEQIAEETATVGRQTLSRAFDDLDPQQRADLRKLGERELELARRLDRLEQRMEDAAVAARQEDPLVADAMADALAHARARGMAEAVRQSGQDVGQNKIGQATQGQRQAAEDLRELLDILSNRREHELGRLVKKLRQAEEQLARLATQQQGLVKKLKGAEQLPEAERRQQLERLVRQQQELEREAARFARSLERLQAKRAGQSVTKAGAKMGGAARSGSTGDGSSAAEQAAAAEADLAEAQQDLAQARRQAEVDLAQEQLARMEDAVASMRDRQQAIVGETVHYQQRQAERGHLTRAETVSVREMAAQQAGLGHEAEELAKSLAGAEVFQFVLDTARREMNRAAERLDRRDMGDDTVRAETTALARIEQLIEALSSKSDAQSDDAQEEAGGGEGGGGGPQGSVRSVAELRLLKSIQQQINSRTLALDEARRGLLGFTEDQQAELAALSQEQGQLADLVMNMMATTDERPEDDPERLPDVRERSPAGVDQGGPEEDR